MVALKRCMSLCASWIVGNSKCVLSSFDCEEIVSVPLVWLVSQGGTVLLMTDVS